jgi:hypothetical protein
METLVPGSCRRSNSFQVLIALLAISLALALPANGQSLAKIRILFGFGSAAECKTLQGNRCNYAPSGLA